LFFGKKLKDKTTRIIIRSDSRNGLWKSNSGCLFIGIVVKG
jgi:hypothetical protein